MAEQRWRAADILRLGIGEGRQLVYTRATRTAQVLPRPQAALLATCQMFRTIDEHAQAAGSQLEPSGIAATRAQLETFARDGLLVEEASIRAAMPCGAAGVRPLRPLIALCPMARRSGCLG
jgi:hypothetical protein